MTRLCTLPVVRRMVPSKGLPDSHTPPADRTDERRH